MENLLGTERIHSCRGFSKQFSLGLKSNADSRQITALQGINSLKCLAFCTSKYRMYFLLEGNYFILGSWNSHKWRVAQKDENVPGVTANQQAALEGAPLSAWDPVPAFPRQRSNQHLRKPQPVGSLSLDLPGSSCHTSITMVPLTC